LRNYFRPLILRVMDTLAKRRPGRQRKLFGPITPVQVKLVADQVERLDWWIGELPEPKPTRAEAIRRLIDLGLRHEEAPQE
jgi:hypothetical protein